MRYYVNRESPKVYDAVRANSACAESTAPLPFPYSRGTLVPFFKCEVSHNAFPMFNYLSSFVCVKGTVPHVLYIVSSA